MAEPKTPRPRWAIAAALVAIIFGAVTIVVGGKTLFGAPEERAAAGNIVSFVDRKSTRLNSSHIQKSRMPSSA